MARTLDEIAHTRTCERILDAARGLFADEGYHATTMNALAEACQLTKASLYHYFESKQAMLVRLHQQLATEAEAKLDSFGPYGNLEEALLAAGQQYLAHFQDLRHRQMMQVTLKLGLHDIAREDPAIANDNQRMNEKLLLVFKPYLPPGTSAKQAQIFAQQFFGSLFFKVFAAEQLCPAGHNFETEEYLQQLVRTFAAESKAVSQGAL